MAASARTSGTRAPDSSSLKRGSCASRSARAAAAALAARRLRAEVGEYADFARAGVFLRLSFFEVVPDEGDVVCWPARVSVGRPRKTNDASRHRKRTGRVGRFGITDSNSFESRCLQEGIGILANNSEFARVLTTPG